MTVANIITAIGLALTILGALRLDTTIGAVLFTIGRTLDLADGWIARRTHSSDLGAAFDAAADKIAVAFVLFMAFSLELVPLLVLCFVAFQNILNATVSIYADRKKRRLSVSKFGKYSMFGQVVSVGGFIYAYVLANDLLYILAWIIFIISAPIAIYATIGYYVSARRIR